jgi:DNA-binding FrmR family transcriptional regulator
MAKQEITIEGLARMINEGFKTTATKDDVTALRSEMNEKFDMVNSHLNNLDARMGRIEADVHALRDEMVHRRECEDVLDRVTYIEKKLSIESGV